MVVKIFHFFLYIPPLDLAHHDIQPYQTKTSSNLYQECRSQSQPLTPCAPCFPNPNPLLLPHFLDLHFLGLLVVFLGLSASPPTIVVGRSYLAIGTFRQLFGQPTLDHHSATSRLMLDRFSALGLHFQLSLGRHSRSTLYSQPSLSIVTWPTLDSWPSLGYLAFYVSVSVRIGNGHNQLHL